MNGSSFVVVVAFRSDQPKRHSNVNLTKLFNSSCVLNTCLNAFCNKDVVAIILLFLLLLSVISCSCKYVYIFFIILINNVLSESILSIVVGFNAACFNVVVVDDMLFGLFYYYYYYYY